MPASRPQLLIFPCTALLLTQGAQPLPSICSAVNSGRGCAHLPSPDCVLGELVAAEISLRLFSRLKREALSEDTQRGRESPPPIRVHLHPQSVQAAHRASSPPQQGGALPFWESETFTAPISCVHGVWRDEGTETNFPERELQSPFHLPSSFRSQSSRLQGASSL